MTRYVITGCAASGTGWAARVMTRIGSPCGHEAVFTGHGIDVRLDLEGDSSWMAVPQLPTNVPVVLLIRDPLRVVASIMQMQFFRDHHYWSSRYVLAFRPDIVTRDRLGTVLRYVANWDEGVALSENVLAVTVDNPPMNGRRMAGMYEYLTGRRTDPIHCQRVLTEVGSTTNSHRSRSSSLSWSEIRAHPDGAAVVNKALAWGYSVV